MKNLFGFSRVLAIGDIHGMYDKLISLADRIRFSPEEDLLVFLGDYIDRGPESVRCLQHVCDLQRRYPDSVVCLLGNHEVMMTSYFLQKKGGNHEAITDFADSWLNNGGFETLQQLNRLDESGREGLVAWAAGLPASFRYQEFFFCHAGIDPDVPLDRQSAFDLIWKRHGWRDRYNGTQTVVVGHTPVQTLKERTGKRLPKPQFLPNRVILCDTGAFIKGGRLSCVDVLSGRVWQA